MDIYSYINSRDVAAYCRKINKVWAPFEMAVIIGRSQCTIVEKHTAWLEIIANYPDMPTPENMHYISYPSLHKKLLEVIDFDKRVLALFMTIEERAVYVYRVWRNNQYNHSDSIFSSFELALDNAKERWECSEVSNIEIEKIFVDDKGSIAGVCDYDGNLYRLNILKGRKHQFFDIDLDESFGIHNMFNDMFYVDIPVPFKKGDILTYRTMERVLSENIFILESLIRDNTQMLIKYKSGECGDGTDMCGWGFYVDDDCVLYGDHTTYHDYLEYYQGKLEGKYLLLHYVSLYLSNDIALPELMANQCRLMLKYQVDTGLRVDTHGRYIPDQFIIGER